MPGSHGRAGLLYKAYILYRDTALKAKKCACREVTAGNDAPVTSIEYARDPGGAGFIGQAIRENE
jgi:hypothetical protein